ncbi:MAG: heavy-metal-associated domain-containing protein [Ferruginibacter sp.]|nr:heavy-metal-associated domain-containing protein [Ferruginibacter sp.]
MKAFSLSLLVFFLFTTAGFAQYQEVKPTGKAVIKTPTILCEKCQEKVEFFISKRPGVTSVAVNIRKKTTTVTWLNDRTTLENIKTDIANLGYDADDIEAEEYAFKRLPKECKAEITAAKAKASALNPVVTPPANNQ